MPSGRHFCLKCTITAPVAKLSPEVRHDHPEQHTLLTLERDLKLFEEAGRDFTKAKLFHNVISPPFFRIPLDQVRDVIELSKQR